MRKEVDDTRQDVVSNRRLLMALFSSFEEGHETSRILDKLSFPWTLRHLLLNLWSGNIVRIVSQTTEEKIPWEGEFTIPNAS